MNGMTLSIKFTGGRWLVNGKRLADLSDLEREFMNQFFQEVKLEEARRNQEMLDFIKRKSNEQNASIKYQNHLKAMQS